jgi:uncharacterized protein
MHIKIHRSYRIVVAMCDSDLLGKRFEQGVLQLDIRKNFYEGDEVSEEQALRIIEKQAREDATFNIVGKEAVQAALKVGIIDEAGVSKIAGIPYALKLL